MGVNLQDYSWIQDFEADFPQKVSLQMLNLGDHDSFSDLFLVCLRIIDHLKTYGANSHAHLSCVRKPGKLGPVFWPITISEQYSFQILILLKKKCIKCVWNIYWPFIRLWSSQYQRQIDRSSDVHNFQVLTIVSNTNVVESRIVSSICTDILSLARPELWPSGKRVALQNKRSQVNSQVGTYF